MYVESSNLHVHVHSALCDERWGFAKAKSRNSLEGSQLDWAMIGDRSLTSHSSLGGSQPDWAMIGDG